MRGFTRFVGMICLWGILVARSYTFDNKSLFIVEVVAIVAWVASEVDWYRKDKKEVK